jgi:hypothetical protein
MTSTTKQNSADTIPKTNLWIKIVLSDDERRRGEEAIAWALKALDNFPSDEELEKMKKPNIVIGAVVKQEMDAIKYFEKNKEVGDLKVVGHVQKLKSQRIVTYKDLYGGEYEVTMPFGNKKITMRFQSSDINRLLNNFVSEWAITWNGEKMFMRWVQKKELTSPLREKYLLEKENEWKKILSKSEFKTLIKWLYPKGNEKEQILAFMLATWFYGFMWLKNTEAWIRGFVVCLRGSDNRFYRDSSVEEADCTAVFSTIS